MRRGWERRLRHRALGVPHPRWALARYRPSGRLDPRFGADGKVQSSFGAAPRCGRGLWDGLAIQPDGRTVVSGGGGCLSSFVMARYLPS